MGVLICDFICFGGTEFSASEIDVIWNSSCRPSVRKSPRPAWPNTSGSQPAVAKSMPWVPSAAPSQPCAKANGVTSEEMWRDPPRVFPFSPSQEWIINFQFESFPNSSKRMFFVLGFWAESYTILVSWSIPNWEGPCTGGAFPAGGVKQRLAAWLQGPCCALMDLSSHVL